MSSPLLSELRERRGLAYHAACGADRYDAFGQFAVEASIAPDKQGEVLRELMRLLAQQAGSTGAVDLERARNQLAVRLLRDLDRPSRRMEQAALDLFALDRVRPAAEQLARIDAVSARPSAMSSRACWAPAWRWPSPAVSAARPANVRARACLLAA